MEKTNTLKTASLILITLGVIETCILVLAIIEKFSFSGGSIFYIYFGYRLLKKDSTHYRYINFWFQALLSLLLAGVLICIVTLIQILTVDNFHVSLGVNYYYILLIITYATIVISLVYFLKHPNTLHDLNLKDKGFKKNTLYLGKTKLIVISVFSIIFTILMTGIHLINNPYEKAKQEIINNKDINNNLGIISSISLLSTSIMNWNAELRVKVIGEKNTGYYYVDIDPDRTVNITIYNYEKKIRQKNISAIIAPMKSESTLLQTKDNNIVLIETSFEPSHKKTGDISPIVNIGEIEWVLDDRAHSGMFSINAIPNGNPGKLSYFGNSLSTVLINSKLDDEYKQFNVKDYKKIILRFWRYSTSNPSKTHNCLGSLVVEYRLDNKEWKSKMVYCGRHKSNTPKWTESNLEFDLQNNSLLEFRLDYEYPPNTRIDETAVYLIDDLQIIGIKK